MNAQQIIEIEDKVLALRKELSAFEKQLPDARGGYGCLYNYLGTLKVNLGSLERSVLSLAGKIKISA